MSDTVRVMQVIETTIKRKGSGDNMDSPVRIITQYWTMDGELIFEKDPCSENLTVEQQVKLKCKECLESKTEEGGDGK